MPVPVAAVARTSCPSSAGGIARACTGVGVVKLAIRKRAFKEAISSKLSNVTAEVSATGTEVTVVKIINHFLATQCVSLCGHSVNRKQRCLFDPYVAWVDTMDSFFSSCASSVLLDAKKSRCCCMARTNSVERIHLSQSKPTLPYSVLFRLTAFAEGRRMRWEDYATVSGRA